MQIFRHSISTFRNISYRIISVCTKICNIHQKMSSHHYLQSGVVSYGGLKSKSRWIFTNKSIIHEKSQERFHLRVDMTSLSQSSKTWTFLWFLTDSFASNWSPKWNSDLEFISHVILKTCTTDTGIPLIMMVRFSYYQREVGLRLN